MSDLVRKLSELADEWEKTHPNALCCDRAAMEIVQLRAKLAEAQQRVCELETKPCSTCGNDEKIAEIVRRLGFRPDIGAWRIRELEQREAWWRELYGMTYDGLKPPFVGEREVELRRLLELDTPKEK